MNIKHYNIHISLHPSRCLTLHRLCSQLYISPPQLCHTLDSTVGTLGSTGGSCRAALGSINFIVYFYNPSLCMHPPSHPTTSALAVHTAVKFCISPCFMAGCSPRLSWSLYLLLDVLLNICVYLLAFFVCFLCLILTNNVFHFSYLADLWPLVCSQKHVRESRSCCNCWKRSPPDPVGPPQWGFILSALAVSLFDTSCLGHS